LELGSTKRNGEVRLLEVELNYEDGRHESLKVPMPATVGKDIASVIRINHWRVSGTHVRVSVLGDFLQLEDLRTFHGTRVNGIRVAQHFPLLPSDEVLIGPARIKFQRRVSPAVSSEHNAAERDLDDGALTGNTIEIDPMIRAALHAELFRLLDVRKIDLTVLSDDVLKLRSDEVLREMLAHDSRGLSAPEQAQIIDAILCDVAGLGVLQPLMQDSTVTEIMVNRHDRIYVECNGQLRRHPVTFLNDAAVRALIERIVYPLGRRIDEASPMVDARLPDGSRVNAVISPIALHGAALTIRKFPQRRLLLEDLVRLGSISASMAKFLSCCVVQRLNILVSGGTGSGKTTLLNILAGQVPIGERIVTIEDAAELNIDHPHVVSLEARPKNTEGHGEITIRDLVRNALRMRPNRIVVGECRGPEALDMLAAMNTGHDGSITTLHANNSRDALSRLETMVLMAGKDLPLAAIRDQIARAIQLVVQQTRLSSGKRVITAIDELTGLESGQIQLQPLMRYNHSDGVFRLQGLPPTFMTHWQPQSSQTWDWFESDTASRVA